MTLENIEVAYISKPDIGQRAEEVLTRFHPTRSYPVPVELILERNFHVDIVPIPGLADSSNSMAFTSANLAQISVDRDHFKNSPDKYRFTLAHELGHIVLHEYIYTISNHRSIDNFLAFMDHFPQEEYGNLEVQANYFAGFFVAPRDVLLEATEQGVEKIREHGLADARGIKLAWPHIIEHVAELLGLTKFPVEFRMDYEGITPDRFFPRR